MEFLCALYVSIIVPFQLAYTLEAMDGPMNGLTGFGDTICPHSYLRNMTQTPLTCACEAGDVCLGCNYRLKGSGSCSARAARRRRSAGWRR